MRLDVGRMSRYRICAFRRRSDVQISDIGYVSDLKPHLETAQIGYEKIGSRTGFCVYTRASNSDPCQIWAKDLIFSASVNAAFMHRRMCIYLCPFSGLFPHMLFSFTSDLYYKCLLQVSSTLSC